MLSVCLITALFGFSFHNHGLGKAMKNVCLSFQNLELQRLQNYWKSVFFASNTAFCKLNLSFAV
jgi:hypothetical protein